jgi:8-oxo-dGTP pyrophosphatase MutT (NUDIX family)
MYEVFFNERKIVVALEGDTALAKEAIVAKKLVSVEDVKNWFYHFAASEADVSILVHPFPEIFWEELFLPVFVQIPAAGGVVLRNGELLFIFRNGKWDLPKGKIDIGETSAAAAKREVAEECGIDGHQITKELPSTFHIYQSRYKQTFGQWIIKETFWFEMEYSGSENGTPETKENITEIKWFAKNELDEVLGNTYENLKSVIALYGGGRKKGE